MKKIELLNELQDANISILALQCSAIGNDQWVCTELQHSWDPAHPSFLLQHEVRQCWVWSQLPSAFRAPVVGCGQEIWQFCPLRKCWLVEPKFCLKKQSFSWKTVQEDENEKIINPVSALSQIKCPNRWNIHKLFWCPFYCQHMRDSFSWVENKIKLLIPKIVADCENPFQCSFIWM